MIFLIKNGQRSLIRPKIVLTSKSSNFDFLHFYVHVVHIFTGLMFACIFTYLIRLLCVEPNRRMNIDQFLDHSWIVNDNIPDTVLFTPKIIADEVPDR